jgi:hypothetical protein
MQKPRSVSRRASIITTPSMDKNSSIVRLESGFLFPELVDNPALLIPVQVHDAQNQLGLVVGRVFDIAKHHFGFSVRFIETLL